VSYLLCARDFSFILEAGIDRGSLRLRFFACPDQGGGPAYGYGHHRCDIRHTAHRTLARPAPEKPVRIAGHFRVLTGH
jgi:hypothetical protein